MNENQSSWTTPVIIIIGALIVAGAFYYQSKNPSTASVPTELSQLLPATKGIDLTKFRPVDTTDKIRGSASAPIKLVVYTDLECPACQYFHRELKKIEGNYVTTGKVALIYRDFPLNIHPKSPTEFLAAECVNELGGLDKYWLFMDKIFEITPSNNGLDPVKLGETAKTLGVDMKAFESCMTAKKYADKIQKSVDEATAIGSKASSFGTPFWVLVTDEQTIPVFGGLPAENLSKAFDLLLDVPVVNGTSTASTTVE